MPQLLWQLLISRNLTEPEIIQEFLSPSLKTLTNPYSLSNMDKAVGRLIEAFKKQERICLYGDYDLDGTSGLALLKRALESLGFQDLILFQPRRLSDGYGLHAHLMPEFYEQGVKLLVTVDVGITAIEAVDEASRLGIDVIITDHHLPKEELPRALAIVNPNKGSCESGLGHLCGAGVAYYLFLALKMEMSQQNLLTGAIDPKEVLDCFVIGTLTDMVPLVAENRVLVKHGLKVLAKTERPGLRELMKSLALWGRDLTSQDVAIRFAPKLNALSRMEQSILPLDIFLEEQEEKARELMAQVLANNDLRVELQKQAESLAFEMVENLGFDQFIWLWSEEFHKGVVGLVATKLVQKYGVPAFVASVQASKEESGGRVLVGSARMPDHLSLNLLKAFESAQSVLEKFGGHAAAAGFELKMQNAEQFKVELAHFFANKDTGSLGGADSSAEVKISAAVETLTYDAVACLSDFNASFMSWYEALGPFGVGFEAPLFLLEGVELSSMRTLKGGHYKLGLKDGFYQLEALWFSPPEGHPALRLGLSLGDGLKLLVEPQWNFFAGRKSLQLLVKDLALA